VGAQSSRPAPRTARRRPRAAFPGARYQNRPWPRGAAVV